MSCLVCCCCSPRLMTNLDGHFKERSSSWSHMLGTQIPSSQGFGASYFHACHQNFRRQLKKLSMKGFQEGHEDAFFDYSSHFVG